MDDVLGDAGKRVVVTGAAPVVLLCSPRMSYVTGEVLWTDGGFLGAVTTGQLQTRMGG